MAGGGNKPQQAQTAPSKAANLSKFKLNANDTPFKLISASKNNEYLESIDALKFEKSIGNQFKAAIFSMFSGADSQDSTKPKDDEARKAAERASHLNFVVNSYMSLINATSTQSHGVTIKTMTKIKEVTESEEVRQGFCRFLYDEFRKNPSEFGSLRLKDFQFYPLKELLIEILSVSFEKKDFRSAFLLIYCTQKFTLVEPKAPEDDNTSTLAQHAGSTAKLMCEYYYSQAVVREKLYWCNAIMMYKNVILWFII